MTEAAAQYRRRADAFEALVAGTPPDRWAAASPCDGWTASDVVAHVVDFSARVLRERARVDDLPCCADFASPLAAFRGARAAVEGVLDDPTTSAEVARYIQWSISFDSRSTVVPPSTLTPTGSPNQQRRAAESADP